MSCFSCCSGCFVDKNQTEYEKQVPGLIKMSQDDIKRSYRGSGKKFLAYTLSDVIDSFERPLALIIDVYICYFWLFFLRSIW